jgi:hypothetical protein
MLTIHLPTNLSENNEKSLNHLSLIRDDFNADGVKNLAKLE